MSNLGYYTSHDLTVKGFTMENIGSLIKEMKMLEIIGCHGALDEDPYDYGDGTIQFASNDTTKWYDHDEDMCELSKVFPNAIFMLHGEGEDREDIWDTYYKNGEFEYCPAKIVYTKPEEIKWED